MRVAVVGAGVSGLVAARTLARAGVTVVLFEKDAHLGGHAYTLQPPGDSTSSISIDLGFMVFNRVTYPNMMALFDEMEVTVEDSDMSFSVSLDGGRGWEWSSNGLSGLFAQKRNFVNPAFLRMIREILKFKDDVLQYLDGVEESGDKSSADHTLGHFLERMGYSQQFTSCYLVPMCASIWSCSAEHILQSSAVAILRFCKNHHLLQIFGRPQWLTVKGRSQTYVQKLVAELNAKGSEIRRNTTVTQVVSSDHGVQVIDAEGSVEIFDRCIIGAHAPDALKMLGPNATYDEQRILGAFLYSYSDAYVHRDTEFMPKVPAAWSAWNFLGCQDHKVCVTYWLNKLQNLGHTGRPFLITLNPPHPPRDPIFIWHTSHPIPSLASIDAAKQMHVIQGKRGIWFCGAYEGYGFHEDGLKSGLSAANDLLGCTFNPLNMVEYRSTSLMEFAARFMVKSFLEQYIKRGYLELQEAGGSLITFGDQSQTSKTHTCVLRIHRSSFYWKIATRGDIGLADAYIDGDFTCADSGVGLLNLFMMLIDNRDQQNQARQHAHNRGWWRPVLFTSIIGSASSYTRHLLRGNSLTNARRNIAAHYDLSNDLFRLFLDETLTYSCAIFKNPTDSLKEAQLRKIHHIINKAQIDQTHEVLEIGFGWGSMALEVVKLTGCKYTGITLSEEQLKLAQERVREAGLEDKITFQLYDYRTLPGYHKYDRIISCEMLEAVGHENLPVFFQRCDHLLAKDGLLVVQVITIPEERYDEYRKSSDFIKEYIFPGGCLPAFSSLTSAMSSASSLCVEHVENIGVHYYPTLMAWRKNFHEKCSQIKRLGFSEKFLRMWDYYFVYCAAGFQTCTLGDLQIVFSRPGNVSAFGRLF